MQELYWDFTESLNISDKAEIFSKNFKFLSELVVFIDNSKIKK